MTRKELIERIDSIPFFSMCEGPSQRETNKNRIIGEVIRDSYKFINTLEGDGKKPEDACEYGVQVWETVLACLKAFDPERGQAFSVYYVCALQQNYRIWKWKDRLGELTRGLKISKEKLSVVMRLIQEESNRQDGSIKSAEFQKKVTEATNSSEGEAADLINLVLNRVLELDAPVDSEDGEEKTEYADMIADQNAENAFRGVEEPGCEVLFEIMQDVYDSLQERQKPLISMMITARLFENDALWNDLKQHSFYNEEVFTLCLERNRGLTAREIAEMVGQHEAQVSRAWNNFYKKLSERRKA